MHHFDLRLVAPPERVTWEEIYPSDGLRFCLITERIMLCKRYCRGESESIEVGTSECKYELMCSGTEQGQRCSSELLKSHHSTMMRNLRESLRYLQAAQKLGASSVNQFQISSAVVSVNPGQPFPMFRCNGLQRTLSITLIR